MRRKLLAVGAVLLGLAGAALFVLLLEDDDVLDRRVVEALAGPQPSPRAP